MISNNVSLGWCRRAVFPKLLDYFCFLLWFTVNNSLHLSTAHYHVLAFNTSSIKTIRTKQDKTLKINHSGTLRQNSFFPFWFHRPRGKEWKAPLAFPKETYADEADKALIYCLWPILHIVALLKKGQQLQGGEVRGNGQGALPPCLGGKSVATRNTANTI